MPLVVSISNVCVACVLLVLIQHRGCHIPIKVVAAAVVDLDSTAIRPPFDYSATYDKSGIFIFTADVK